ncbi:CidA/LrgA family protein [Cohnella zeiphila]|uniref:CidA/LrgA family holin-like protein n=1 Tax=Cohnella zeiphila TaxID=2761120 RepID=A0A7X0SU26_9BACL|nr:CidA/LrgA family holin-like protein [Cohnella zeiphila]MBB6736001.1 CidA/LrgA family holin-like protein [Cohnella zeiphila]
MRQALHWGKTAAQIALLVAFAKAADLLVAWLHAPVPGSVAGIALLFALLKLRILRLEWVELGAKWLLAEMLLFFVPAAVGIVDYGSLIAASGWRIVLTIAASTAIVMIVSGWVGGRVAAGRERKMQG